MTADRLIELADALAQLGRVRAAADRLRPFLDDPMIWDGAHAVQAAARDLTMQVYALFKPAPAESE